jgi:hypothetical protein
MNCLKSKQYVEFSKQYVEFSKQYVRFSKQYVEFSKQYVEFSKQYVEFSKQYVDYLKSLRLSPGYPVLHEAEQLSLTLRRFIGCVILGCSVASRSVCF